MTAELIVSRVAAHLDEYVTVGGRLATTRQELALSVGVDEEEILDALRVVHAMGTYSYYADGTGELHIDRLK